MMIRPMLSAKICIFVRTSNVRDVIVGQSEDTSLIAFQELSGNKWLFFITNFLGKSSKKKSVSEGEFVTWGGYPNT